MKEWPHCPKCNSKNTFKRMRTKDYICRRCKNVFALDVVKKEGEN